jgi:hypothetical protein
MKGAFTTSLDWARGLSGSPSNEPPVEHLPRLACAARRLHQGFRPRDAVIRADLT